MDFMEAVEEMKRGKKVRLSDWVDGLYIMIYKNKIVSLDAEEYTLYPYCFDAEWELFEEPKKTLSNMIQEHSINHREGNVHEYVLVKDIREFIDKLKDLFLNDTELNCPNPLKFMNKLDELSGERFK